MTDIEQHARDCIEQYEALTKMKETIDKHLTVWTNESEFVIRCDIVHPYVYWMTSPRDFTSMAEYRARFRSDRILPIRSPKLCVVTDTDHERWFDLKDAKDHLDCYSAVRSSVFKIIYDLIADMPPEVINLALTFLDLPKKLLERQPWLSSEFIMCV